MHTPPRSNAEWLAAIREPGDGGAAAVSGLGRFLRGALARALRGRQPDLDLEELVQESLTRILDSLDTFRGDSAFTTWAVAVATRVAFTELRRRRVRRQATDGFAAAVLDADAIVCEATAEPVSIVADRQLLAALRAAIAHDLSERQRIAIVAELRGVPTVEIAARLGTNQNALYKLVHDARKKLRRALAERGFGPDSWSAEETGARR